MNTELSYFEWLGHNPELAKDFQQWMTLKQQTTPNWADWFDIKHSITDGFNDSANNVLLVDIGGGEGHYLHALNEKVPSLPGRLVLQDLPHVVSSIKTPPKGTDLMPHDFFTPQPVKGRCSQAPQINAAIKYADGLPISQVLEHIICTGSFTTGPMNKPAISSAISSKLWNLGIPASLSMSISSLIDNVTFPLRA